MIGVYAERMSVAFISSAAALKALRTISVVMGSMATVAMPSLLSDAEDQRPQRVDGHPGARGHDGRRGLLADDGGPLDLRAAPQVLAAHHRRVVASRPNVTRRVSDG
jgi:hypothetical protein